MHSNKTTQHMQIISHNSLDLKKANKLSKDCGHFCKDGELGGI